MFKSCVDESFESVSDGCLNFLLTVFSVLYEPLSKVLRDLSSTCEFSFFFFFFCGFLLTPVCVMVCSGEALCSGGERKGRQTTQFSV